MRTIQYKGLCSIPSYFFLMFQDDEPSTSLNIEFFPHSFSVGQLANNNRGKSNDGSSVVVFERSGVSAQNLFISQKKKQASEMSSVEKKFTEKMHIAKNRDVVRTCARCYL